MTIAFNPIELFVIPELRPDRPRDLLSDDISTSEHLEGSAKALATARKISHVAKAKYGWSDSKIEELLRNPHEVITSLDNLDSVDPIARDLIVADANYNFALLAEQSSDISFWLNHNPKQREKLFAFASQLRNSPPRFRNPTLAERLNIWKRSVRYGINLTQFLLEGVVNLQKFADNAAKIETIFEHREAGRPRVINFSKMTPEEREIVIEHSSKKREERYASYTKEELDESDRQFDRLFATLEESRE